MTLLLLKVLEQACFNNRDSNRDVTTDPDPLILVVAAAEAHSAAVVVVVDLVVAEEGVAVAHPDQVVVAVAAAAVEEDIVHLDQVVAVAEAGIVHQVRTVAVVVAEGMAVHQSPVFVVAAVGEDTVQLGQEAVAVVDIVSGEEGPTVVVADQQPAGPPVHRGRLDLSEPVEAGNRVDTFLVRFGPVVVVVAVVADPVEAGMLLALGANILVVDHSALVVAEDMAGKLHSYHPALVPIPTGSNQTDRLMEFRKCCQWSLSLGLAKLHIDNNMNANKGVRKKRIDTQPTTKRTGQTKLTTTC